MTSCVSNLLLSDELNYIPFSIVCICRILFSHLSMQIWIVSLSCSKPYGCAHIVNSLRDFQGFFHSSCTILIPTENAQGFLPDSPWRQVATCLQSKSACLQPRLHLRQWQNVQLWQQIGTRIWRVLKPGNLERQEQNGTVSSLRTKGCVRCELRPGGQDIDYSHLSRLEVWF